MQKVLDLTQAREAATMAPTPVQAGSQDDLPTVGREMEIPITAYYAPDGTVYRDVLRSRVLTFDGKAGVARMEADLCAGRDFRAMSPQRQEWIRKIAYVTFHLVEVPKWLNEWAPVDDVILDTVWSHCAAHDYLFFRSNPAQGAGASGPGRRVETTSTLVALADQHAARSRE